MRITSLFVIALAATPVLGQDLAIGAGIYQENCATCHGIDAKGNGPMSPVLLVQPSDLTTLTERHGGEFPVTRVVTRIDGRDPLVSHGSNMPIFGEFFEGVQNVALKTASGQPILVSQPVADIVAYLREIQE